MDAWEEFMKQVELGEYAHLYKTHPLFDGYPQYVKDALIQNEILQGRVKKPKSTK